MSVTNEALLRGITHKDLKALIAKALHDGWEYIGISGKTLAVIQFRGGKKLQFSMTASGNNAHKDVNAQMRKISGKSYLSQAKTGRSKGGVQCTDFSMQQVNLEQTYYHTSQRGISEDSLVERHEYLISKFTHFAKRGSAAKNQDINTCIRTLKDIRDLERLFHAAFPHVPMLDFDPESIDLEEENQDIVVRTGDIVVPVDQTQPFHTPAHN